MIISLKILNQYIIIKIHHITSKIDTNQVRSKFGLKMYADQFFKIKDFSQTVHHNKLQIL
jgi:hypothetical protein